MWKQAGKEIRWRQRNNGEWKNPPVYFRGSREKIIYIGKIELEG